MRPGSHTSPQNTLTNFWRTFVLMFVSGVKLLDTHSSTSFVEAGIGVGINGSEGGASPPWNPEGLLAC